jgi:hypothetical protein
MGARISAISRVGGEGIDLFPHIPQVGGYILLHFYGEFDILHFENTPVLAIDKKEVLASPAGHSPPHICPVRHSPQFDALIGMPVRIRVEYREEHLPYGANMGFKSRRDPEQIAQPLWSHDVQTLNLLKWEPDILIMDNDFKKWRQQIVTVAPRREGLSRVAPFQRGLGMLRLLQECHSLCWLMVAELV